MKKLLAILLILTMSVCCLSLAACGDENANGFMVSWKNWNGDFIKVDMNVEKGAMPTFGQTDPTRPDDEDNTYTFAGWEPALAPVTADVTYTATFTATPKAKNEVTAQQYIAAFSPYGQNFKASIGSNRYIEMLEDGSFYMAIPDSDETYYLAGIRIGDNVITFEGIEKKGVTVWEIADALSLAECQTGLEGSGGILGYLVTVRQVPFQSLTYDANSKSYKGGYEGSTVEMTFADGRLIKSTITADGMPWTIEFEYGTANIKDKICV